MKHIKRFTVIHLYPWNICRFIKEFIKNPSSIINVSNVVKSEEKNEKPLPNKSPSITNVSTLFNVMYQLQQKVIKKFQVFVKPMKKGADSEKILIQSKESSFQNHPSSSRCLFNA